MKYPNAICFLGLVFCGLTLVVGFANGNGNIEAISSYFGLFLVAYAVLAYLFKSALYLVDPRNEFWSSLFPVNFGISLLGLSLFGIHDLQTLTYLGVIATISAVSAYLFSRTRAFDRRFVPIGLVVLLVGAFATPIHSIWPLFVAAIGMMVLVKASVAMCAADGSTILGKKAP